MSLKTHCLGKYFLFFGLFINLPAAAQEVTRLSGYRIDPQAISISGVSAGGYLANQFHVAHSRLIKGAAIIAAGPYFCAGGNYPFNVWRTLSRCMNFEGAGANNAPPSAAASIAAAQTAAAANEVDDLEFLKTDKVLLFSGKSDHTVPAVVTDRLYEFYAALLNPNQIHHIENIDAGHGMITETYGKDCSLTAPPYINDCDYDLAGEIFTFIYGPLQPKTQQDADALLTFSQTEFSDDHKAISLHENGHIYVPQACRNGDLCRLHIALHGCRQQQELIDDAFYKHAGYNEWAESNQIIVLYPQAQPKTYAWFAWPNPRACWDWWGYSGDDYHLQSAPQIRALYAMIQRLLGTNETHQE